MCGYQDDVDQDFGDLQQNFQILTCFFDFGVLLQDKLTSSINRQIPPQKKLPGCDIFFSKICSTKTLAAISASNMTGSRSW